MTAESPDHGTSARYIAGCRCDCCREANRQYKAEWRADNRGRVNALEARQNRRLRAAWAWIKTNRPDVAAAIREEATRQEVTTR